MGFNRNDRPMQQDSHRVNNRIRIPEILVIDDDGAKLGIMPTYKALDIAKSKGLDLVEVNPTARPPVCKILDYGKFKYDESKKKVHQKTIKVKEVIFGVKTSSHDLDFKKRNIEEFLREGNKVQISVRFRGREMAHPEEGYRVVRKIIDAMKEISKIEHGPIMEGRRVQAILASVVKKHEPKIETGKLPIASKVGNG